MKPIEKGELITLSNDKEFLVVDIVYDNSIKYLYFARNDGEFEILLGKEIIKDNEIIIETLGDKEEIKKVMAMIASRYMDSSDEIM